MSQYSEGLLAMLSVQLGDVERASAKSRTEESGFLLNARKYRENAEAHEERAAELRRLLAEIDPEHAEQLPGVDPAHNAARIAAQLRAMADLVETLPVAGFKYVTIEVDIEGAVAGAALIDAAAEMWPGAQREDYNSGFSRVGVHVWPERSPVHRRLQIRPAEEPEPVDVHAETLDERDDVRAEGSTGTLDSTYADPAVRTAIAAYCRANPSDNAPGVSA
jgi:hypothetical protein